MRPAMVALSVALWCPCAPAWADEPAPEPVDQLVVIGDGVTEITVPVGVDADLLLRHSGGYEAGYAAIGAPLGVEVTPDGRFHYHPDPTAAGGDWTFRVEADGGFASGMVRLLVPAEGAEVTVSATVEDPFVAPGTTTEAPPPPTRRTRSDRAVGGAIVYGGALGTWLGGTLGFAIGDATSTDWDPSGARAAGTSAGVLLGSGLGAGTAALVVGLRPELRPNVDQVVLLSSTSGAGAFTGMQLARALIPPGAEDGDRRIALSGTLGALGGTGVGVLWSMRAPPARVMANFDLGAAVGWQAAAGALDMTGLDVKNDRQIRAGVTLASAYAVGGVVGALRANGVAGPRPGLLAVSMTEGAWIGAWAPLLVTRDPDTQQVVGGMRLGLGAGYALSQLLAPVGEVTGRSAALMSVGWAAGSSLGAGIPMAAGVDPTESDGAARTVVAPMLAGSVGGLALGAAIAPKYDLSGDDAALIGALGAWTTYQAVGWSVYASYADPKPSVALGTALATGGAGTLLGMGLAPLVDLTPPETMMAMSMGGWGTWYGGWIGHLARLDADQHWALTLSSGDAALLGTALALSGPMDPDWVDLALVDGFTSLGGAMGSLTGIIASPEVDPVAIGGLVGTSIGLGTGIALAARRTHRHDDVSLAALGVPIPNLSLPVDANVQAMPWTDDQGQPGVWVQVDLFEKAR